MKILTVLQRNIKERLPQFILLICTAVLIIICGIWFHTPFFRLFPLFISLFIILYQSEANRYAFLAGGLNSINYSIVYASIGIYASAASALLFSCPMQIATFILWNRRAYKKTVVFRKMSFKIRLITLTCFIAAWCAVFWILKAVGSEYAFLDNTSMLLGILVTVLTLLAFREYSALHLLHVAVSLALQIQLSCSDISNLPLLIYSIYTAVCAVRTAINVRHLCKEQEATGDSPKVPG